MSEPLKNYYDHTIPRTIAEMISFVYPDFDSDSFITHSLVDFEPLNLMDRGRKIAYSMHQFLPDDYPEAISILMRSLDVNTKKMRASGPMDSFLFLPYTYFVAFYGLSYFEESMHAQYLLTQKFTAEFSIRPFLVNHTRDTLLRLADWTSDPSPHVRRLVSEGTRPRLPWAPRLGNFQKDPRPVLELLERLKDDESEYVRRSVANNLNDIGKDHPELLISTTRRWMDDATPERRKLIRHALRTSVKDGNPEALSILGFGNHPEITLENIKISPEQPKIGESVKIGFSIKSTLPKLQGLLVDFQIHYIKANGKASLKVFKLKEIDLPPDGFVKLGKSISLAEMTTRKHYPGNHKIDALINGIVFPLGSFDLR